MLTSVSIKSFRCIQDVELSLEPMTILAGPNGCGKTSVLDASEVLCSIVRAPIAEVLVANRSPAVLRTYQAPENVHLRASVAHDEDVHWSITVHDATEDEPSNVRWLFAYDYTLGAHFSRGVAHGQNAFKGRFFDDFRKLAPSAQYLRFEFERLIAPSFGQFPHDRMQSDGSNLPSLLATIRATMPETFDKIQEQLRRVVPTIAEVGIDPVETIIDKEVYVGPDLDSFRKIREKQKGFRLRFTLASGAVVPASSVSEGSLLTLAVLAFLHAPERPDLVLIDNLERGLHPKAIKDLVHQLREIQSQMPKLQIIATTHSPYVLEWLEPQEVRLMCLDQDGHTVCGVLNEHPDYPRWKDEMFPGEFWTMVGEQWLLDRKAAVGSK